MAVYREIPRIARKDHACVACGAIILKGEAYSYVSYIEAHAGRSEKECFACWWTRVEFREAHGASPVPSGLREELIGCIDGDRTSPWRPHLAALKRRWRTSAVGRKALARKVFRTALALQLALAQRIVQLRVA